jgi:5-formyltetrahydrofolate cyclo-ligase
MARGARPIPETEVIRMANSRTAPKSNPSAKAVLRDQISAALAKMPAAERTAGSEQIRARLEKHQLWRRANSVLFYAPFAAEPDVWRLLSDALAAGKSAFLPRFDSQKENYVVCEVRDPAADIETGQFGIREPRAGCPKISLNRLDLILVPGIAFDLEGRRLGRGKGYYDRLLAELEGEKCGVAFDQQIVNRVPVEPHDMRLNCIVTPTRWQAVTGRARF